MKDEIDRYKRLLEDWQGEKTPPPKSAPSAPSAPAKSPASPGGGRAKLAKPAPPPAPAEEGRFPSGTIIVINDEDLVIYRRPVAGKPFDMVYSLLADGTAKIEAVDMNGQQLYEMGRMPPEHFKRLQAEMRWTRKMVAEGCSSPEDAERLPDPGEAPEPPSGGNGSREANTPPPSDRQSLPQIERNTPPPMERNTPPPMRRPAEPVSREESAHRAPQPKSNKLKRGQRFTVMFGNKSWEAVYWGRDTSGSVVAHNTHRHWTLMHLDLERFKDTIVLHDEPDPSVVDQISRDLATLADFE